MDIETQHKNKTALTGNKNASKGKENHTAHVHILCTGEQKGLIKQIICGDKKLAPTCLNVLLLLVKHQVSADKLKEILENRID